MNNNRVLDQISQASRDGQYAEIEGLLSELDRSHVTAEQQRRLQAAQQYLGKSNPDLAQKFCELMNGATAPPTPTSITAIIQDLRRASGNPRLWEQKPQSGGAVSYLSWQTVTELLDTHAPGWNCRTVGIRESEDAFIVTVELSLAGATRQASYRQPKRGRRQNGASFDYTAPLESAERRAMTRAASLFGVGATPPPSRNGRAPRR